MGQNHNEDKFLAPLNCSGETWEEFPAVQQTAAGIELNPALKNKTFSGKKKQKEILFDF